MAVVDGGGTSKPKPKPKPPKPAKPSTGVSAHGGAAGAGAVTPNNPKPTYVDDGSYLGGNNRPGFNYDQGYGFANYDTWLWNSSQDATFNALKAKYGNAFVAFQWWASRTGMQGEQWANEMDRRFGGWRTTVPSQGSGGRGLGGGGGGASLAEQYAAAEAAIRNEAATLGLPMKDEQIKSLAKTVVSANWSNDQLMDYLTKNPAAITKEGTYKSAIEQIKAMASAQLVHVSDATASEWARAILSGEKDISTVATVFANQAAAEFGWAAQQIHEGTTMRDLLMPARDKLASELELNPDTINFNDDRWRKMVQVKGPDGKPRAATMTEVTQAARRDAAWADTSNAAQMAASMATMLRQAFEG